MRFLETERRDQAPVDADEFLRILEVPAVERQNGTHAEHEVRDVGFGQPLQVSVVAVDQAGEGSVAPYAPEERLEFLHQFRIGVLRQRPGELARLADREG